MDHNLKIKQIISYIKTSLRDYYPPEEISGFIFLIFEHFFSMSRTELLMKQDTDICHEFVMKIKYVVNELRKYRPLQYIINQTEFFGLPLFVNPDVLIPRPETEELVDWIIQNHHEKEYHILDIATGSGCVAIALKKNLPDSQVFATDVSEKAIEIAKNNAQKNNAQVHYFTDDIFNSQSRINHLKFDIIVSNPPYVTEKEKKQMQTNVLKYEPHQALFVPDHDPLVFHRVITDFSIKHLKAFGWLYLEINEAFGKEAMQLLKISGFSETEIKKDINGKNRMIKACWKNAPSET